jgi:hypothetical protein
VTGSFVSWNRRIPLQRENGIWAVTLDLSPGNYVYKFVIDGVHWYYDMSKDHKEDSHGNINNFIVVESPPESVKMNRMKSEEKLLSMDDSGIAQEDRLTLSAPVTLESPGFEVPFDLSKTEPAPIVNDHNQFPIRTSQKIEHARHHSSSVSNMYKIKPVLLNECKFEPQITQNVNSPKLKLLRTKFNSTASLFVDSQSIILDPDLMKTLRCKSIVLHWMMKDHEKRPPVLYDVFSEDYYRKKNNKVADRSSENIIPSIEDIYIFLQQIFTTAQSPAEVAVMALAYIERLLTLTDITFHISNWKLICLGAIIVARKVWVDKSRISNKVFLRVFNYMTIDDLAIIEREYLSDLQYIVSIKPSIFAKYYFALRSIAEKNETNFPLKPLSKEDEAHLESLSHPNANRIIPISPKRKKSTSTSGNPRKEQSGGE